MASTSETSFGARLRKLQDTLEYIKKWPNYQPPRPQEEAANLQQFITSVLANNAALAQSQATLSQLIASRQNVFGAKNGSVTKLLSPLRNAVIAQYGNKSSAAIQVSAAIEAMRKTSRVKVTATAATNSDTEVETGTEKFVSQSQQSIGSRTQYFSDLVNLILTMPDYKSSNPTLSPAGLQAQVESMHTINNLVAAKTQELSDFRSIRSNNYVEMAERIKRIKAYTRSQYGNNSQQYKGLVILGL